MTISFFYYALLLYHLSFGDIEGIDKTPLTHLTDVQIYYFYDSRLPSEMGQQIMFLTENLLSKQYQQLVADGDIILYKVDLATPTGQKLANKCDVVLNGLVVSRGHRVVDLTQKGYQLARSNPKGFQETLAYEINRLLPKRKRPK
ncbi:MAG: hypothetical protein II551_02155 [Paludibacteraceae bacterium]|nr:hypothetical protein [Paludibacteraceae bacterium]